MEEEDERDDNLTTLTWKESMHVQRRLRRCTLHNPYPFPPPTRPMTNIFFSGGHRTLVGGFVCTCINCTTQRIHEGTFLFQFFLLSLLSPTAAERGLRRAFYTFQFLFILRRLASPRLLYSASIRCLRMNSYSSI